MAQPLVLSVTVIVVTFAVLEWLDTRRTYTHATRHHPPASVERKTA